MKLKLEWNKSPRERGTFIGICEELPDSYCHFTVKRLSPDLYWIIPPTLIIESVDSKLMVRDNEIAKDFCEDFLNYNIKAILRRQITEMKGSNAQTIKPVWHYERLLQFVFDSEKGKQ